MEVGILDSKVNGVVIRWTLHAMQQVEKRFPDKGRYLEVPESEIARRSKMIGWSDFHVRTHEAVFVCQKDGGRTKILTVYPA